MPATVIVGLQWGDEGKGKTTDFLAEQVAMAVRYQGGDNAGHTVVLGDEVFKLRLTPSGVLYPHITCVIGPGVVVNPETLIAELDMLDRAGHRHGQGPGQPQRARDHAVPRRPGPGDGGPAGRRRRSARRTAGSARPTPTAPRGSACGWKTCSTRTTFRSRLAKVLPDKNTAAGLDGRRRRFDSRTARRARRWPGASGCDRTWPTRPGSSRMPCAAATTSSSKAPRARSSTSTTAATPTSPRRARSPAAPAPAAGSARSRSTRSSG